VYIYIWLLIIPFISLLQGNLVGVDLDLADSLVHLAPFAGHLTVDGDRGDPAMAKGMNAHSRTAIDFVEVAISMLQHT